MSLISRSRQFLRKALLAVSLCSTLALVPVSAARAEIVEQTADVGILCSLACTAVFGILIWRDDRPYVYSSCYTVSSPGFISIYCVYELLDVGKGGGNEE